MIPARIGSTRLAKKNLALLDDKPLIFYAIDAAKKSGVFENIFVNSESIIFKDIAERYDICFYHRPKTMEEMCTAINDFAPHVGLIVVDSITCVSAAQELERELEKDTMALIPRKLSQFFRMTNPVVGKSNCVVLLVNQVRVNMQGTYAFDDFPGGNALRHYCSCILHTARGKKDDNPKKEIETSDGKKKKVDIGFVVNFKLEKTKISSTEGQKATINFYFDKPHFDPVDDLFKAAVVDEIIERGGAWYNFRDTKIQGSDAFIQAMRDDKKLFNAIKKEVLK